MANGQVMATMSSTRRPTVAVIGIGAMGTVAIKNLLEEGFDVTGFERSCHFGGLWRFSQDPETLSVLESTKVNISIDKGCFTDFPFPEGTPSHCSAKEVEVYLHEYIDHFELLPCCRLNTTVTKIVRENDQPGWRLDLEGLPSERFDKVVMATGPHARPMMPTFPGAELFEGRIIHSKAFKRPQAFENQKVVVVGLGNTGGDVSDELVGHASSISLSYNHGAIIIPREVNGKSSTSGLSHRFVMIRGFLDRWAPPLADFILNKKAKEIMRIAFGQLDPAWRLLPAPSVAASSPVISDTLISHFRSGAVRPVKGIRRVTGPRELELSDGTRIEADAIICCTGYENNFDLLEPLFDPAARSCQAWLQAPGSKNRPLPRLYQNVFSLECPDSLAFLGSVWLVTGAFCLADIASMCIAQVWAGKSTLPPAAKMSRWADQQERRICRLANLGSVIPGSVAQRDWLVWADKTAGMGVEEHLGWGWKGWRFWWMHRRLYSMLMDGPIVAPAWRLFRGKRRHWEGARRDIERANGLHMEKDKEE